MTPDAKPDPSRAVLLHLAEYFNLAATTYRERLYDPDRAKLYTERAAEYARRAYEGPDFALRPRWRPRPARRR